MSERKDVIWRIYIVFLVMVVMCVAIITKVFAIQNSDQFEVVEEAKKEHIRIRRIPPVRGTIYSYGGEILATSDPVFDLHWDATVVEDERFELKIDSLCMGLASIIGKKSQAQWKSELVQAKEKGSRYHLIAQKVSRRDYRRIMLLPIFRLGQFAGGFISEKTDIRKRQFSPWADRTVGYTLIENDPEGYPVAVGKVGIENAYDEVLAGVVGQRRMRKSGSVWIPVDDKYIIVPENGKDVYTTIDMNIQDVAETELMTQLTAQGAEHGCAIVMEVNTGYIKAIANLSRTDDGGYYERYNHAIASATEPGSTFKLASLIVALEDGVFDLDDEEDTEDGTHKFYDRTMRDSRVGGYGKINTVKAFAVSSNVWFSKMIDKAYKNTPQKYADGIQKVIGGKTGISLKGETRPYIKNATDTLWSGVSLPWMSIGYETKLTPLQILTMYNAVANNGVKVMPQLVKEIRSNGEVVETFDPVILDPRLCSQTTLKKVRICMEAVVQDDDGTGRQLRSANFKIAGKTGTTQLASGNLGYKVGKEVKYQASFCGYFPADKPKYSCIVVIAAPEKQKYGAEVAGTVFKEIADKVYMINAEYHKAINRDEEMAYAMAPVTKSGYYPEIKKVLGGVGIGHQWKGEKDNWVMADGSAGKLMVEKRYIGQNTMPNVVGMGLKDALYILENRGLQVRVKGSGKVTGQSIQAGKPFNKNDLVEIVLK